MKAHPDTADFLPADLELLTYLLDEQADDSTSAQKIPRREHLGEAPLSFAQQRLWLLDQLEPGKAAYNIPLALRLIGSLQTEAFERALQEIVRRHEVLRTAFTTVDGQPRQVISPSRAVALPVVDLTDLMEGERQAEVQRRLSAEAQRPFDLAKCSAS